MPFFVNQVVINNAFTIDNMELPDRNLVSVVAIIIIIAIIININSKLYKNSEQFKFLNNSLINVLYLIYFANFIILNIKILKNLYKLYCTAFNQYGYKSTI